MDDLNWVEGITPRAQEDHYRIVRADPWSEYTDEEEGEEMGMNSLERLGADYIHRMAYELASSGRYCKFVGHALDDDALAIARVYAKAHDLALVVDNDAGKTTWLERKEDSNEPDKS